MLPDCLILLLLLACHHPTEGAWEGVEVNLDPLTIRFGNAEIPEDGLRVGLEAHYDPAINHDPWNLFALPGQAPSIDWRPAKRASWDGDALLLELRGGETARLSRREGGEGLALRLEADAAMFSVSVRSDDDEALYGGGEIFDAMNLRRSVRPMQIELSTTLESSYNEVHVPVPFVVAETGWGLGFESDWPAALDLASTEPDQVTGIFNSPSMLDFRLLSDDDPAEVPAQWARSTALPRRPPDWALAPMLWRDEDEGQDTVLADARAIRDNDLAFGVMWIDNPWQTTYNSMAPDPSRFPDWNGMIEELHALGFAWLAWTTPYLEDADPDTARYAANGWFADIPVGFNNFGPLVDLTNPEARAAWTARTQDAAAIGIQGWKLDYGEDVQLGWGEGRLESSFANGQDERTMHHRFVEAYHGAYADAYPDGDRFLLGRAGAWGSAAVTDCIWPGDLDSDFRVFGEDGHVGGLPSVIRAAVSLSVSGFPCFASDTGGYRHDRPTSEVMIRWTEFSALLPVMQVGGSGEDHNYWNAVQGWDEATLEAGQRFTQLHLRLFPFFQALMMEASTRGTPPLMPTGLLGGEPVEDEIVVGKALLLAPVATEGALSREVIFPPGTWVHWWTGEAYSGSAEVDAPLGYGPLFQREGTVVPLLSEEMRSLSPADSVPSWADDPGVLTLRIVPGEGSFSVIDGPSITLREDEVELSDSGIYGGLIGQIWAPDASELLLDGRAVATRKEGPWLIAELAPGLVRWQ